MFETSPEKQFGIFVQGSEYGSILVVSITSFFHDFKQDVDLSVRYFMQLSTELTNNLMYFDIILSHICCFDVLTNLGVILGHREFMDETDVPPGLILLISIE